MGIRFHTILLCLLCASLPVRAEQGFPLRITDDTGVVVTLPAAPRRIVSLTLAADEMLMDLVDPARIQGVTNLASDPAISNVADRAAAVPNKLEMNVETILSIRPDLVLVADWSDAGPVRQLRDAGVPVYLMKSGVTIASIERKIERLALLAGQPARGRDMIRRMEVRLRAVELRVSPIPRERRLSVIDYATWGSAQGRGSSWDEMLQRAGLINGVSPLASDEWGQVPLSREKLLALDPDMLVLPGWVYNDPSGARAFYAQVTRDPSLRGLRAVKTGRVCQMPERLKSTTSQYVAEAVEWLARTAYPERFR